MGEKIKIAEVVGKAKTGGVINCVYNFFKKINKNKFQIDFFSYGETLHQGEIEASGGRIFKFPSVFRFVKCIFNLRKRFKKEKYDVVHVHMTTLSFVPLCAAWLAGVKVRVCHSHSMGNKGEGFRYWVKMLLRPLSKLFATHLAGCSKMANTWLYGKKKGEKAFLLHNAIDINRFSFDNSFAEKWRAKNSIGNAFLIGVFGRIEKQKNIFFAFKVFSDFIKLYPFAKLLIIGDGSLLQQVKENVDRLGITDNVIFLNHFDDIGKMYSVIDVFMLPSLYEGLPLVLVEAQINGLPCLASDKITREISLTDLVEFLPIDDTTVWVNRLSQLVGGSRQSNDFIWQGTEYDINEEVLLLESFYEKAVNQK